MNGKGIAIVLTLSSTLMLAMMGWLAVEQRLMRNDIADLRERMARLEGPFEGHVTGDCNE